MFRDEPIATLPFADEPKPHSRTHRLPAPRRPRPRPRGGARPAGAKPPPRAPAEFFGIGPQTPLSPADTEYMKAGGIGIVRMAVPWSSVQESRTEGRLQLGRARRRRRASPPAAGCGCCPSSTGRRTGSPRSRPRCRSTAPGQRREWTAFLTAAVERYGPGGGVLDGTRARRRAQLRAARSRGRCRSAPGRSGTRPTSSTSPARLAEPLREAGRALEPGAQSRRPRRQADPHRALRETDAPATRRAWPPTSSSKRSTGCRA